MTARDSFLALFGTLDEASTAELDRRLGAHRVENREEAADWLASYPFPADTTDWARGRTEGVAWAVGILRNPDPSKPEAAEQATFFEPGHTYARDHHASTIRFLVKYLDDSPCGTYRVAFGWRIEDGDVTWSPSDSDDFTGWTDVTEAGEPR